MSNYDPNQPPPPPPSGQPYGQPNQPAPPYGQPPYGQPTYGQQPYGQPGQPYPPPPGYGAPVPAYSNWLERVASYLIDGIAANLASIPLWIGYIILMTSLKTTTDEYGYSSSTMDLSGGKAAAAIVLIVLGLITGIAFFVWNTCLRQGRTGQSIGKSVLGIKLVKIQTGQPVGGWLSFGRYLLHILDGLACYLGYLWPIWDAKRQTFADKIVSTVVVRAPKS